jgi:hypothetical protein
VAQLEQDVVTDSMREFLEWVVFRPRTYADVLEAWQSHCPRFTLWEDALERQLIVLDGSSQRAMSVQLTPHGRAALASCTLPRCS